MYEKIAANARSVNVCAIGNIVISFCLGRMLARAEDILAYDCFACVGVLNLALSISAVSLEWVSGVYSVDRY